VKCEPQQDCDAARSAHDSSRVGDAWECGARPGPRFQSISETSPQHTLE